MTPVERIREMLTMYPGWSNFNVLRTDLEAMLVAAERYARVAEAVGHAIAYIERHRCDEPNLIDRDVVLGLLDEAVVQR